jgi:hypothetical protein
MPSLCYQITLHSENSDSDWSRSINDVYVVRRTLYDDSTGHVMYKCCSFATLRHKRV